MVSAARLTVDEGDSGDYTVALATQPTGSVTVAISSNKEYLASVTPKRLTFTTQNWSTPQTVKVTAHLESNRVLDEVWLTHTPHGYGNGGVSARVTVSVNDRGSYVRTNAGVMEFALSNVHRWNPIVEGSSGTYTMWMRNQPTGPVTVAITHYYPISARPISPCPPSA